MRVSAIGRNLLTISVLLSLHGAPLSAAPIGTVPGHSGQSVRAACPTVRNLAPASWDARPIPAATLDRLESFTRGASKAAPVPAGADIVLRSFAGPSETLDEPMDSVATVWRDAGHAWHVDKVDYRTLPGATGQAGKIPDAPRRTTSAGVIHPLDAATLDRLVADPCLYLEPTAPDVELMVRDGVVPAERCYSGAGGIVEITRSNTRLVFNLLCPRLLAGELLRVALYPRLADGKPVAPPRSNAFDTTAQAHAMVEKKRKYYHLSVDWENATTSPVPEIRNRRLGIGCRMIGDGALFDFDPANRDRAAGCASRGFDGLSTSTLFLPRNSMTPRTFAARYAPAQEHQPRPSSEALAKEVREIRLDGRSVATLELIDGPHADARTEQYSRSYAGVIGDHLVATRFTGPVTRRREVERRARAEWRWLRKQP